MFSRLALVMTAAATVLASGASAQDAPVTRLSLHGYLTQAYGKSSGGPTMGLTDQGTADYRRAAILARYGATPNDHFVVQLGHRRLGDSPSMQFEENVKVDMAFYEHRFDNGTNVRVGKVLMPFGIYNDIRYAGALLPFYRAPMTVYFEGMYTNETVDGVTVGHVFRAGEPWELSAEAFGGSYQLLEMAAVRTGPTTSVYAGALLDAKNALGAQLWLATPLEGLRLGVHGRRHTAVGGVHNRGTGTTTTAWNGSVDGTFSRWQLRAEAMQIRSRSFGMLSRYAQVGYRPVGRLSLNLQTEASDIQVDVPRAGRLDIKWARDDAAGVNLHLNLNTVLKVEAHTTRGFFRDEVTNMTGAPRTGAYYVTSLSVSF